MERRREFVGSPETHALIQAAVERERMLQESRNEKVLKMFQYKDQHAGEVMTRPRGVIPLSYS